MQREKMKYEQRSFCPFLPLFLPFFSTVPANIVPDFNAEHMIYRHVASGDRIRNHRQTAKYST